MDDSNMTTKEIARLIQWLKSNGATETQVYDCINYIADSANCPNGNKKSDAPQLSEK